MIILFFILVASCSKEKNSFFSGENKMKFVQNFIPSVLDNDSDDEDDYNYNNSDEDEEELDFNDQEIEDEYVTLFQLVEEKRNDLLLSLLPNVEDLDILEEENENKKTFLHLFIEQVKEENYKEEKDLIEIIEILKIKQGFDWNKKSSKGSYAFIAFKNNLFFTFASILKENFDIGKEDFSAYINLIIDREERFSNECFRLFLSLLSSIQLNELIKLLDDNLSYYENTSKGEFILNLVEWLREHNKKNLIEIS